MAKIFKKLGKKTPKPPSPDYSGPGRNSRLGSGSIRSPVNEFDDDYDKDPELARMGSGRFSHTTDTLCSVFGADSNVGTFSGTFSTSQQNPTNSTMDSRRTMGYDNSPNSPTKKATVVLDDYSDPKDIRKALEQENCYSLPQDSTFDSPPNQTPQPPEDDYSVPYEPRKRAEKGGGAGGARARVSNGGPPTSNRPSYHGKPKQQHEHPENMVTTVGEIKAHHNGLTLENGRLSPRIPEATSLKSNNTTHSIPTNTQSQHNAPTIRSDERKRLQSTPESDVRPRAEYDEPWEWQMRRNAKAKEEASTSPNAEVSVPRSRSRSDVASLGHGMRPTPETDNRPPTEYDEPWEWKKIREMNKAAQGGNREHTQMSRSSSCSNKPTRLDIMRPKPEPIGEYVDSTKPLQEQGWYHGKLSRCDAEKKLKSCREGSYLVRQSESSAKDFSLSLKSAKGYMHMKIVLHQEGYILGEFSKPFKSIPSVISHYSTHKLNIKCAEHMMLLYAVHDNLL